MNLISQNCLAGNIYKNHLKTEFNNPFIWTVIDFNSMLYLIQNWNDIDFEKYDIIKDKNWNFSLIINNAVKVQCVHYIFNPNCKIPTLDNVGSVHYCKIWEYINQKYEERLNRMKLLNENPIFCICNFHTIFPDAIYTNEQLEVLSKYNNVYVLRGCENKEPVESACLFYNKYLRK